MVQMSGVHTILLLFLPIHLPDVAVLFLGAACAFLMAYLFTIVVGALCRKKGWLDRPAARRVHVNPVPRLGGVAMFSAFLLTSLLFYAPGTGPNAKPESENLAYWLLIVAATLIVVVHVYDDLKGLKPLPKLIAQTIAVIIVLGPGRTAFYGILLYTFNNPFGHDIVRSSAPWYESSVLKVFIDQPEMRLMAIPAVLFTWLWIVGMMNTVNLIDGLDGLASGVVGIAAAFITVISWQQQQYSMAILAAIFTGSIFGFLPHNWNPAKIFMGDSGSMFLGLGLSVLSIMGGAKLALVLMVLGVPILDVAVVMINRIRRGQSPLHYDKTHLHYRLMAMGLSAKQICLLFYSLTFAFGLMALSMPRIYKLIGITVVILTMTGLIVWVDRRQRKHGALVLAEPVLSPEIEVEDMLLTSSPAAIMTASHSEEPLAEANSVPLQPVGTNEQIPEHYSR
ncbi:MAG TPA: MraY family glycosyltransferase [Ktedonobacteraceae bacterium]|nr:MraY family glycosyltransferase [Ktedonobacteraceae bacterium]